MKSKITSMMALVALGAFTASAWACGKCPEHDAKLAKADAKGKVTLAGDRADVKKCPITGEIIAEKDCPLSKRATTVLASMPDMKFRIGDKTTGCSHSAAAMAKKSGKPMRFVVGDADFEKEGEALVKLVALLDAEVKSLKTMQFSAGGKCYQCPMSAKQAAKDSKSKVQYRVGGIDFDDKSRAEKAVALVSQKLADIKMTYKVGDQSFCCDKMAGMTAKKASKNIVYVVGSQETPCQQTAQVNLAQEKIRTIVETAAAAAVAAVVAVSAS